MAAGQVAAGGPAAAGPEHGRSARDRLALTIAAAAGRASRLAGRGDGGVIGGRLALGVSPGLLATLAARRTLAVVSGTNGKTTTTAMLAAALAGVPGGPVVANTLGANMPAGLVTALADADASRPAVLEVDESYLPAVVAAAHPRLALLLNLSRDQLDRLSETRMVAGRWRTTFTAGGGGPHVVANADDPLVAWAAGLGADPEPDVTWVGAGTGWRYDAASCPRCGAPLADVADPAAPWHCPACGLRRPPVGVALLDDPPRLVVEGAELPLTLALPGRANQANAAMVVAAAVRLGVDAGVALAALAGLASVAGRYAEHQLPGGPSYRLLLAKNPAGWTEALPMLDPARPLVLSVNARVADGRDTSWLWDVPYEQLRGRSAVVTGERGCDLALRLTYAGVAHELVDDPRAAVRRAADGAGSAPGLVVDVLANYTAFHVLRRRP